MSGPIPNDAGLTTDDLEVLHIVRGLSPGDRAEFIRQGKAALQAAGRAAISAPTPCRGHLPDAELLALGRELDAALVVERAALAAAAADDDAAIEAALDAVGKIIDRIPHIPATTLEGLAVKARAFLWCGHEPDEVGPEVFADIFGCSTDQQLAGSVMRDLVRLLSDRRGAAG